ncbi:type I pullulanase [Microbacteriaceae bacterium 4G12]
MVRKEMLTVDRIFEAYLDEMDLITILLPRTYGVSHRFHIKHNEEEWELEIRNIISLPAFTKYECIVKAYLDIGQTYIIRDDRNNETDLQIGAVIRTNEFDEAYYYEGNDLGASYRPEQTICKVWAPVSSLAKVRIYEHNGLYKDYEMERQQNGVWSRTLQGNFEGASYTFLVCNNLVWREVVDPYAKAVSMNGELGVIADLSKTAVKRCTSLPLFEHFTDAIIYEAHIRDLTIHPDSGIVHKGKYLGLTERQTTGPNGTTTGLSYLQELGITHVELLPFHDFEGVDERNPSSQYNWGYNPIHYNVPEGSYATNPQHPYSRIIELKQMIQAIHQSGIRVIMDVVYNHVYTRETSSFEKLVPGYYFRHDENGMPSNGTGVGNDIASERKMVRKFIADSILYWLQEYDIDGFRFDLMGILDFETMNTIRREIDRINRVVLLLGEGWDLHTPLAKEKKASLCNAHKMPRIAQFNDQFRDHVKGSTFTLQDRGYAFGDTDYAEELVQYMSGSIPLQIKDNSMFLEPNQTINYVESHDNFTMWDKLFSSNKEETESIRKRRHLLATTMTLLAQGIPFLHAGQEFYRTKQGVENSYNAPDEINWIDWKRKQENEQTIEYVKGVIAIRKAHGAFRLPSANFIRKHMKFLQAPRAIMMYQLHDVGSFGEWKEILVIFNSSLHSQQVVLPDKGKWYILANEERASATPITSFTEEALRVAPVSTYILTKM